MTTKERYQNFMAQVKLLLGGRCVRCGSTDTLEFDHVDSSTKLFKIASGWQRPRHIVLMELAKCQLLCFACHRNKTYTAGDHRKHTAVRLTEDAVRRIRLNDEGWSAKTWAKHLGVHPVTVMKVVRNEAWEQVKVVGPRRPTLIQVPVKLSPELVRAIRAEAGQTGRALAKKYGVAPASISRIRRGHSWKEVTASSSTG